MSRFKNFTAEEKESIYIGLGLRKNLIETGDHGMSPEAAARWNEKVRAMTPEQMKKSLGT
jgi:hypothetical protein